jgi:dual specificity phosphatase 12
MNRVYHHIPCPSFTGKLYLSSISGLDYLNELNVHYIVSLFPVLQNQSIPNNIIHDEFNITDRGDIDTLNKMNEILDTIVTKIYSFLSNNQNVLVHCFAGISRSATVVCDFLCKYEVDLLNKYNIDNNLSKASIQYVRKFREQVYPNPGFIKLLKTRNS